MNEEELKAFKKLEEQIAGFKDELKEASAKEGIETLKTDIDQFKKDLAEMAEKDVDAKILEINKEVLKFRTQIIDLREEQQKAKDQEAGGASKRGKGATMKEVQAFVDATFKDGKKTSEQHSITLKDAEIFGTPTVFTGIANSDSSAFTGRYIDPTLYQRRRKKNLILDHFSIMSIGVPELLYLEKAEVGTGTSPDDLDVGGADWIASGASKPLRSFRVGTGKVEAKKLAIFATIEDKLLRDVPSFANWINDDFTQEMRETYNDGLLNNNPAVNADAPLGIKQNAVTFAVTPAFDELFATGTATTIDAIVSAVASMADSKESPDKIFISSDMFYAIHVIKDTNQRYQDNNLIFTNSLGQLFIAGVEVVPSDREDIPNTHFLLVGAEVGFKIHNYGAPVIERGLNADDFRKDSTSFRGYQEVLSYIPAHRENSVMYDTFANVVTAIEVVV